MKPKLKKSAKTIHLTGNCNNVDQLFIYIKKRKNNKFRRLSDESQITHFFNGNSVVLIITIG
ncbi:hypothetical protein BMS3Abin05_02548 [bacterium BMS3Abin05]|nr:hypothetical protein BMS3Abin05_02548 [bacterium BMS3Abin05]GBE27723.1 hypothetical protein BMS3Bbin03_01652 [bacterium BMS3Bbin03]